MFLKKKNPCKFFIPLFFEIHMQVPKYFIYKYCTKRKYWNIGSMHEHSRITNVNLK